MTFVTTAMVGLTCNGSSWKLDSSSTTQLVGDIRGSSPSKGRPMLPPTNVSRPAPRNTSPSSEVVVVLPALPVMPMIGAGQSSKNSSIRLVTGMPRVRAAFSSGLSGGTPGDAKTTSTPFRTVGSSLPST